MSQTTKTTPSRTSNNRSGIFWGLIAAALFSVVAALGKVAVTEYHVLQILFFRQVVVFLSSLPSISTSFPHSLKTRYPGIHSLRLLGAFVALSCGIWAVAVLPLTAAITLGFSSVFFVALLAFYFLGEQAGRHKMFAILIGFIGVIIVMRPTAEGIINVYALIPVIGALGAGVAITCVRKLSQTESTATLLVYQALFVGLLAGVPLIWLWVTPDLKGIVLLFSMGIIATIGQWTGVKALRLGEASIVGSLEYSKLVYAVILGYLLFNEIPEFHTIAGAIVIICSSAYLLHREATNKKRKP